MKITPIQTQRERAALALHPLVAAAALAIIALCVVAIAALAGWLPGSQAQQAPDAGPPAVPAEQQAPPAGAPAAQGAPAPVQSAPPAAPRQAAADCRNCGTVESVRQIQVPVGDRSNGLVGTVAGGVVGGVVGNQFGGGSGKTALTILGGLGGALAGREIERNIQGQRTVTRHEMRVRMSDGSLRTFTSQEPFHLASGDHVLVQDNGRVVLR
ncbi:glycine zipper 2TM domain-containing protein [Orrella sp. JC864]|uniref:glycine zipper 2TM domain-containing protein n=1 Tax=Orrella sp. JC864 TaxID=3120298 RepID=UPI00300AB423